MVYRFFSKHPVLLNEAKVSSTFMQQFQNFPQTINKYFVFQHSLVTMKQNVLYENQALLDRKKKCHLQIKIIIQSDTKKSFFLWLLFKIFSFSSILNNLNSVMSWYSFLHIPCVGSGMSSVSWTQGSFCTVAWKCS